VSWKTLPFRSIIGLCRKKQNPKTRFGKQGKKDFKDDFHGPTSKRIGNYLSLWDLSSP
jgi:hypothetical protein